jgi:hypothetical protein
MHARQVTVEAAVLDDQVLALFRTRRTLMFSALAEAFPECKWQTLFAVLRRLQERHQVELLPHRWDYEIVLRSVVAGLPGIAPQHGLRGSDGTA